MKTTLLVIFILLFSFDLGTAQGRMGQGQGPGPGQARRIEQFKKLRLIEALKLDEDTSVRFFAKYNKHEEAMRDINKERETLLDQLQDLRKSEGKDDEMSKIFENLTSLDRKLSDERARFIGDIKTVLSTKQIADLVLFERNFARNVRQLMQEMTQQRGQGMR